MALAAVGGVLAVKGVAMIATGLGTFGVMHVLWLDLTIVVPLGAVFLLWAGRRRASRAVLAVALVAR